MQLHIKRQRGGNPIDIHFLGIQPFRLQEHLMSFFVGKAHHLIFDRGTIARADALNFPEYIGERCILPKMIALVFSGIGNMAGDLRQTRKPSSSKEKRTPSSPAALQSD